MVSKTELNYKELLGGSDMSFFDKLFIGFIGILFLSGLIIWIILLVMRSNQGPTPGFKLDFNARVNEKKTTDTYIYYTDEVADSNDNLYQSNSTDLSTINISDIKDKYIQKSDSSQSDSSTSSEELNSTVYDTYYKFNGLIFGGDYLNKTPFKILDTKKCIDKCNAVTNDRTNYGSICTGISYNNMTYECNLYSNRIFEPIKTDFNITSYINKATVDNNIRLNKLNDNSTSTNYTRYKYIDSPYYNIETIESDIDTCMNACTSNVSCVGFVKDNNKCYLKNFIRIVYDDKNDKTETVVSNLNTDLYLKQDNTFFDSDKYSKFIDDYLNESKYIPECKSATNDSREITKRCKDYYGNFWFIGGDSSNKDCPPGKTKHLCKKKYDPVSVGISQLNYNFDTVYRLPAKYNKFDVYPHTDTINNNLIVNEKDPKRMKFTSCIDACNTDTTCNHLVYHYDTSLCELKGSPANGNIAKTNWTTVTMNKAGN